MTIKAVFGAAAFPNSFSEDAQIDEVLSTLLKEGVTTLDTARLYEGSEVAIGRQSKKDQFTIDTKFVAGFFGANARRETLLSDGPDSLARVGIKQFDIFYFHAPDSSVPWEEQLAAVDELHKKGLFKRLGLSNYTPTQVQEVYDVAKSKGYILPSVYQGNYNPLSRNIEADLFPVLRKLNMSFYAYSPIAGGFLTKTTQQLDDGVGRFNSQALGGMYKGIYDKPSFREALSEWNDIAKKEGVSNAELAYRWVGYNSELDDSKGDAVIFGASKLAQIPQTAQWLKKGKLSDEAAKGIDAVWAKVKGDATTDNYQFLMQQQK